MAYPGGSHSHGRNRSHGLLTGSRRKSVMSNPGSEGPGTGHKALSGARSDMTHDHGSPEKAKSYAEQPSFRRM